VPDLTKKARDKTVEELVDAIEYRTWLIHAVADDEGGYARFQAGWMKSDVKWLRIRQGIS